MKITKHTSFSVLTLLHRDFIEKVKQFWSDFGQGVSVSFVVATLVAEQDNLLTGLFFAIFTGASLFVGNKIYQSFKK